MYWYSVIFFFLFAATAHQGHEPRQQAGTGTAAAVHNSQPQQQQQQPVESPPPPKIPNGKTLYIDPWRMPYFPVRDSYFFSKENDAFIHCTQSAYEHFVALRFERDKSYILNIERCDVDVQEKVVQHLVMLGWRAEMVEVAIRYTFQGLTPRQITELVKSDDPVHSDESGMPCLAEPVASAVSNATRQYTWCDRRIESGIHQFTRERFCPEQLTVAVLHA